jgi:D-tyrosyl-tRNA(Tyr) deacylase
LGLRDADTQADIDWLVGKLSISNFGDENNVMNLSVQDIDGDISGVSLPCMQLLKGNRPSYIKCLTYSALHFVADMQFELINDGPVTIIIDRK